MLNWYFFPHQSQAFCPSPYVESSLATLMTGAVPMHTMVLDTAGKLSPDVTTLAQELVATGFEAAGFISRGGKHLTSGLERGLAPCEVLDTDEEALAAAMSDVGRALFITSFALVCGFLVNMLSVLDSNATQGVLLSTSIVVALAADFFFMPALVLTFKPFGPEGARKAQGLRDAA